jgi:hypothetical protein
MPIAPTPINGFLDEFMCVKVVETSLARKVNRVWSRRSTRLNPSC